MICFLYVLGILLLLLILILLLPFRLHLYFLDEFRAEAGFLFLKFPLFPASPKEEKKEKKPKKEKKKKDEKKAAPKKEKKKRDIKETLSLILKILKSAFPPFRAFLKKVRLDDINIEIMVSSDDAYETAKSFNTINGAVLSIIDILGNIFTVNVKSAYIYPNFEESESRYYFEGNIKANILSVLIFLISLYRTSGDDIMKLIK